MRSAVILSFPLGSAIVFEILSSKKFVSTYIPLSLFINPFFILSIKGFMLVTYLSQIPSQAKTKNYYFPVLSISIMSGRQVIGCKWNGIFGTFLHSYKQSFPMIEKDSNFYWLFLQWLDLLHWWFVFFLLHSLAYNLLIMQ